MPDREILGEIVDYDGTYITIRAPWADREYITDHKVRSARVLLDDGMHITARQNKGIHATLRDIAEYTGNPEELTKETLKIMYAKRKGIDYFSLSDVSMDTAGDFLDFILSWSVENGIPLSEKILDRCDDVRRVVYACTMAKKCVVCGAFADLHHVDTIGMGGNRDTASHLGRLALPLCRMHHVEVHQIGKAAFEKKYAVTPVKIDKKIARKYKLKF